MSPLKLPVNNTAIHNDETKWSTTLGPRRGERSSYGGANSFSRVTPDFIDSKVPDISGGDVIGKGNKREGLSGFISSGDF